MMIPISVNEIMAGTGANRVNAAKFLEHIQAACKIYHINTPQRVAGFLSQIGHESGGLARLQENLNYSVLALTAMFGRHRISLEDAKAFGRAPGQTANQEAIANTLYGGAWGARNLGNTQAGDGWRYRGRGLKQLTGRDNYKRCGDALKIDLVANPDLLLEPGPASMSAGWFWSANGCNSIADHGDMAALTKRINGGDFGLRERTALYNAAMSSFA
jgi:putative chitinase